MSERKVIDARGSFCPGPLMELIGWIKLAQVGDELAVLSTDKGSANEIPEWVKTVGNDSRQQSRPPAFVRDQVRQSENYHGDGVRKAHVPTRASVPRVRARDAGRA